MRRALPLLGILLFAAAPAAGDPSYSIAYWNGGAYIEGPTSSAPLADARSYGLAPSGGSGTFTGSAHAGPGYVNATGRVDCSWESSGGFSGRVDARTSTTDMMVTGPPGNVLATLNVRVHVDLSHAGGYLDNNGTGASFEIGVNTPYAGTISDLFSGGHSTYGTGLFSAITSPGVDMILPITGNYPTNVPFVFSISLYCAGFTYGGVGYSPAMAECDAGGPFDPAGTGARLEMVNGQVMTLPAGYDFQVPSWGIYGNTYAGPVAVPDAPPPGRAALRVAGANPTAGDTRVALTLPHAGLARVTVFDVAGRAVRNVFDGWQPAGEQVHAWDGRDDRGALMAAGIYVVRAEADGHAVALRVVRVH